MSPITAHKDPDGEIDFIFDEPGQREGFNAGPEIIRYDWLELRQPSDGKQR